MEEKYLIELRCVVALSTNLVVGNYYKGYRVDGGYRIPTFGDKIGIYYSDHRFVVEEQKGDGFLTP